MLVAKALQLIDEFWRDAVDSEGDQLFETHVIVAAFLQFGNPFRRGSVNSHGDQSVFAGGIARCVQRADPLWSYAVDAEDDELVAVRNLEAGRAQICDES